MQKVFEKIKERLREHNLKLKSMKNMCIALSDNEVSDIENHAFNTAIEIVDQVAKEFATDINVGHNDWIPCSEKLPDDREEKLVCLSSNRMTIARYNEHRLPHSGSPIGWGYSVHGGYIDFAKETVIAWQPLPEPYKEELCRK